MVSCICFVFTPKIGEDFDHFDEHIFQMGWFNHQLVMVSWCPLMTGCWHIDDFVHRQFMMVYELMVYGCVWFMNLRGADFLLGAIRSLFVIDPWSVLELFQRWVPYYGTWGDKLFQFPRFLGLWMSIIPQKRHCAVVHRTRNSRPKMQLGFQWFFCWTRFV